MEMLRKRETSSQNSYAQPATPANQSIEREPIASSLIKRAATRLAFQVLRHCE